MNAQARVDLEHFHERLGTRGMRLKIAIPCGSDQLAFKKPEQLRD